MKIVWSPLAIDRVAEIAAWIAADRPAAAERLVEEIFTAAEGLAQLPLSGREVPEFQRPEFRELIHRSYRIICRMRADDIEILTVRHSLQLLEEDDLGA